MIKILVKWEENRWSTGGQRDDDEWSRDSSDGELAFVDYKIFEEQYDKSGYYSELATIKEDTGTVFVIFSCYDTGDSFGHDANYFQFIEAFSDIKNAEIALKQIDKQIKKKESLVEFTNDVGEKREVYLCGLEDYFGSLNYIEIKEISKNSTQRITYH